MRKDATFIGVEVDDAVASDPELARKLAEVCPVDIYADGGGRLDIVEENLDECILCEMCIKAAPPGTVRVLKLYSDEVLGAGAS
jgi:NAD-dependent dihydropyrimidine dehydrogenase PreA subunit